MKSIYKEGEKDLFSVTDDFCPIMIQIETIYPQNYRGKGRRNCQFTYGCFDKDVTRADGTT